MDKEIVLKEKHFCPQVPHNLPEEEKCAVMWCMSHKILYGFNFLSLLKKIAICILFVPGSYTVLNSFGCKLKGYTCQSDP